MPLKPVVVSLQIAPLAWLSLKTKRYYWLNQANVKLSAIICERSTVQETLALIKNIIQTLPGRIVQIKNSLRRPPNTGAASHTSATAPDRPGKPPVWMVSRIQDPKTLELIRSYEPDLILGGGRELLKKEILSIPKIGILGCHYGLLPSYRGVNVTEWAIFNGDPVGVSVFLIDQGIDTGAIVAKEEIPYKAGDTIEQLRNQSQEVSDHLISEHILPLYSGKLAPQEQCLHHGRQYYRMHPSLKICVYLRLRQKPPQTIWNTATTLSPHTVRLTGSSKSRPATYHPQPIDSLKAALADSSFSVDNPEKLLDLIPEFDASSLPIPDTQNPVFHNESYKTTLGLIAAEILYFAIQHPEGQKLSYISFLEIVLKRIELRRTLWRVYKKGFQKGSQQEDIQAQLILAYAFGLISDKTQDYRFLNAALKVVDRAFCLYTQGCLNETEGQLLSTCVYTFDQFLNNIPRKLF